MRNDILHRQVKDFPYLGRKAKMITIFLGWRGQNQRRRQLSSGVILLRDNAGPLAAALTEMIREYCWKLYVRPPSSLNFAPSSCIWNSRFRFGNDNELKNAVVNCFNFQVVNLSKGGLKKLEQRDKKYFKMNGDIEVNRSRYIVN